jgi:hypothetical protein
MLVDALSFALIVIFSAGTHPVVFTRVVPAELIVHLHRFRGSGSHIQRLGGPEGQSAGDEDGEQDRRDTLGYTIHGSSPIQG